MYELIKLTEHDYFVNCPSKIGIIRINENEVILVDSGNDKDAGKKVYRILQENGWSLKYIINTHSHADHIGGNRFLQEKTGCTVFANGLEQVYASNTLLEPISLYGGLPISDLKHKFLMAQTSCVDEISDASLPSNIKILHLPGHCFDMIGVLTEDKTAFIGDSITSEESLEKYGIGYLWDVQKSIDTLNYLKEIKADVFVPSHADVTNDIINIAERNIEKIYEICSKIKELCSSPVSIETLLKNVFDYYNMTMNAVQYALISSTLKSYLTFLYENGEVDFSFENNEMLWKQKQQEK